MVTANTAHSISQLELASENIAVKIRWLGLFIGYVIVNVGQWGQSNQLILNAILTLGLLYAVVDTIYSIRGKVFLERYPLLISLLEAFFIGLLCFFHDGLDSPFRFYYILSLLCCAIRHPSRVTYITCIMHCASYAILYAALPHDQQDLLTLLLTIVILGWLTWACDALSQLLKRVGENLRQLNSALQQHQSILEARIAERTLQLQEAQALVLHQEKMAAFGLLAAGIAHEVGNPLTSISSIVQMLQRRGADDYTTEKLALVNGQLKRIQTTLRELINFSRPASGSCADASIADMVAETLQIAKYYKRTKQRRIEIFIEPNLPAIRCKREIIVQAIVNLVFNAIDATDKDGCIILQAHRDGDDIAISVRDNGHGIFPADQAKVFQPYFTTKGDGTGLGLFVTQKLVAEHGGTITFTSQPGEGTTFVMRIPWRSREVEEAAKPSHVHDDTLVYTGQRAIEPNGFVS